MLLYFILPFENIPSNVHEVHGDLPLGLHTHDALKMIHRYIHTHTYIHIHTASISAKCESFLTMRSDSTSIFCCKVLKNSKYIHTYIYTKIHSLKLQKNCKIYALLCKQRICDCSVCYRAFRQLFRCFRAR